MILLRISNDVFHTYLRQRYFDSIKHAQPFGAENIIITSFDSWKYNYESCPEGWKFVKDNYLYRPKDCMYFPYKKFSEKYKSIVKVVKFLTKKDYKKFVRYYKKNIEGKHYYKTNE